MDPVGGGVYIVDFTGNLVAAVVGVLLPLVVDAQGLSLGLVGIVMCSFAIGNLTFSLVAECFKGAKSKYLLVGGGFIVGICIGFLGTLRYLEYSIVIVVGVMSRILQGVGSAMASSGSTSIVSKKNPIVVKSLMITAGLLIGPILGSLLYHVWTPSIIFIVLGGIMLVVSLYPVATLNSDCEVKHRNHPGVLGLLKDPGVVGIGGCVLLSMLILSAVEAFLTLHLREYGVSVEMSGFFFTIAPLCSLLGLFIVECPLPKKDTMLLGMIVNSAGTMLLGPVEFLPRSLWTVAVGLIFIGMGVRMTIDSAIFEAIELRKGDVSVKSRVIGLFLVLMALGEVVGPCLVGFWSELLVFETVMGLCGLCNLIYASFFGVFYVSYLKCCRESSQRERLLVELAERQ